MELSPATTNPSPDMGVGEMTGPGCRAYDSVGSTRIGGVKKIIFEDFFNIW
jgi:hypothetical protein